MLCKGLERKALECDLCDPVCCWQPIQCSAF